MVRPIGTSAFLYSDKKKQKGKKSSKKNEDNAEEHLSADAYVDFRRNQLKDAVKEWYPADFEQPSHKIGEILAKYAHLENGDTVREDSVVICGRIQNIRTQGKKLYFIDVRGQESQIQVKAHLDLYGETLHSEIDHLRRGDLICIRGHPSRTKAGELSVSATKVTLTAPCMRIMANNKVELENVDKRFRRRHVDFLVGGGERREVLKTRHKVFRAIRQFLDDEGND